MMRRSRLHRRDAESAEKPAQSGFSPRPLRLSGEEACGESLGELFKPEQSPDLTRAIMGRLGYMQAKPRAARRHRVQRGIRRAGLVAAAALAIGVGLRVFEHTPDARQPGEPVIPAALGQEIERQQQNFGAVIRSLRSVAPAGPAILIEHVETEPDQLEIFQPVAPPTAPLRWA